MWIVLEANIDSTQRKIIVVYRTPNHRLAIVTWRWTTIPISADTKLSHFCSYNAVENETHSVLECSLYNITLLEIGFHHYLKT